MSRSPRLVPATQLSRDGRERDRTLGDVEHRRARVGELRPQAREELSERGFLARVDLVRGRLTAVGRLHRGTAHLFRDAVSTLVLSARELWIIDVSEVTVSDSAGLRAIGNAYRRALRLNRRLTLLGPSPALRQALVRLRLDHHVMDASPDSATDDGSTPSTPSDHQEGADGAGRPVPGLIEALSPREDESQGGTEEVLRRASGAGGPVDGRCPAGSGDPDGCVAAGR